MPAVEYERLDARAWARYLFQPFIVQFRSVSADLRLKRDVIAESILMYIDLDAFHRFL